MTSAIRFSISAATPLPTSPQTSNCPCRRISETSRRARHDRSRSLGNRRQPRPAAITRCADTAPARWSRRVARRPPGADLPLGQALVAAMGFPRNRGGSHPRRDRRFRSGLHRGGEDPRRHPPSPRIGWGICRSTGCQYPDPSRTLKALQGSFRQVIHKWFCPQLALKPRCLKDLGRLAKLSTFALTECE